MVLLTVSATAQPESVDEVSSHYAAMNAVLHHLYQITPRGAEVRRQQETWEKDNHIFTHAHHPTDATKIDTVDARTRELVDWEKVTSERLKRRFTFNYLAQHCVAVPPPDSTTPKADCRVEGFGSIGRSNQLRYQIYRTEKAGSPATAIAVFASPSGEEDGYELVGWAGDQVEEPALIYSESPAP